VECWQADIYRRPRMDNIREKLTMYVHNMLVNMKMKILCLSGPENHMRS
jgi:hypothetical protein